MKNYEFNVRVVGKANLSERFFEGIITHGEYKDRGIDLPFIGARIVDFRDPLDPFITEVETRWALNPGDEVIASVTPSDLKMEPIASFSWGPATSKTGKQLPFGKAPASKASEKGRANNRKVVGTIYLPEPGLRKSPLGHVSVVDVTNNRQVWCGPINPERFPAALDDSTKYRYFAWTVSRDGVVSKVEICNPLDVEIRHSVAVVLTPASATPAKAAVKVIPVVEIALTPVLIPAPTQTPTKAKGKGKKSATDAGADGPLPRKPAKVSKRHKRLSSEEEASLIGDGVLLVKNSGPKVPVPTQPPTAKAGEVAVPKIIATKLAEASTEDRVYDEKDKTRYRIMNPDRQQLDIGKLKQLVGRAIKETQEGGLSVLVDSHVTLEWEKTPRQWVRCAQNIVKVGVDAYFAKNPLQPAKAELATA